jgi:hypothetical protein
MGNENRNPNGERGSLADAAERGAIPGSDKCADAVPGCWHPDELFRLRTTVGPSPRNRAGGKRPAWDVALQFNEEVSDANASNLMSSSPTT